MIQLVVLHVEALGQAKSAQLTILAHLSLFRHWVVPDSANEVADSCMQETADMHDYMDTPMAGHGVQLRRDQLGCDNCSLAQNCTSRQ